MVQPNAYGDDNRLTMAGVKALGDAARAVVVVKPGIRLREIMEYLGHSSLAATERYVKLLPRPEERGPADRLNDYVARATGRSGW